MVFPNLCLFFAYKSGTYDKRHRGTGGTGCFPVCWGAACASGACSQWARWNGLKVFSYLFPLKKRVITCATRATRRKAASRKGFLGTGCPKPTRALPVPLRLTRAHGIGAGHRGLIRAIRPLLGSYPNGGRDLSFPHFVLRIFWMFLKTWQKKSPSDERGLGVVGGRKRERDHLLTSLGALSLFCQSGSDTQTS